MVSASGLSAASFLAVPLLVEVLLATVELPESLLLGLVVMDLTMPDATLSASLLVVLVATLSRKLFFLAVKIPSFYDCVWKHRDINRVPPDKRSEEVVDSVDAFPCTCATQYATSTREGLTAGFEMGPGEPLRYGRQTKT